MSALDKFASLDNTLQNIKDHYAEEIRTISSKLQTAEIELELTRKALDKASERAAISERLAIKLITQFGTVEQVFNEAKRLALQVDAIATMERETREDPSPFAPNTDSQAIQRLGEVKL